MSVEVSLENAVRIFRRKTNESGTERGFQKEIDCRCAKLASEALTLKDITEPESIRCTRGNSYSSFLQLDCFITRSTCFRNQ